MDSYALLAAMALLAGALNSIAGGGTLLTFPALLGVVTAPVANATSTIALLPGSIAAAWGYRREVAECRPMLLSMFVPSLLGGILGAWLVTFNKDAFTQLVPWLILTAAMLFLVQRPLSKWLIRHKPDHAPGPAARSALAAAQFLIAVYGGYFGAGIGILMLTALGFMGLANIHHANGVKTVLAAVINAASVVIFLCDDLIRWDLAGVMALAAVIGGYFGARVARRLPVTVVRRLVIAIGFSLAAYYFWKQYR